MNTKTGDILEFEEKHGALTKSNSRRYADGYSREVMRMSLLQEVRAEIAALDNVLYFNWGASGPSPARVVETAHQKFIALNDEYGPMAAPALEEAARMLQQCRAELARLLSCSTNEIALMESTSDGINRIAWGLSWQAGDEVIISDIEHISGIAPWLHLAKRYGISVVRAPIAADHGDPAPILERVTDRTRLVFVSHVSYKTGAILPLADIAKEAERRGFLVGVDGAQAVGQMPVSPSELGVHFYAMPGQKWLLGPDGTGALFVREDALDQLAPSTVGWASLRSDRTDDDQCDFHVNARKYEVAGRFVPAFAGLAEAVSLIRQVGVDTIQTRIAELAGRLSRGLRSLPRIRLVQNGGELPATGLVALEVDGIDPSQVVKRLWQEHQVVCRWIDEPRLLRFSVHAFNDEAEIDRVVEAVREVLEVNKGQ